MEIQRHNARPLVGLFGRVRGGSFDSMFRADRAASRLLKRQSIRRQRDRCVLWSPWRLSDVRFVPRAQTRITYEYSGYRAHVSPLRPSFRARFIC